MDQTALARRLLATFLEELDDHVRSLDADLIALEGAPADAERLRSVFRSLHTLKGAARAAGVPDVEEATHRAEEAVADVRDGRAALVAPQIALLFETVDRLRDAGQRIRPTVEAGGGEPGDAPPPSARQQTPAHVPAVRADVDRRHREPVPAAIEAAVEQGAPAGRAAAPTEARMRVAVGRLDGIVATVGELLELSGSISERPAALQLLNDLVGKWRAEWGVVSERALAAAASSPDAATLVPAIAALDATVGEVQRELRRSTRDAGTEARALTGVAAQLTGDARRLRMRPFGELAEALPRTVRDLAVSLGKQARFELEGGEVEADRAVLDALRDVLLHMVRNAVDHGIEPAAEREAAGKPAQGTVRVRAEVRADRLEVTVGDDGRGLDVAAIGAALRRRGEPVPATAPAIARALLRGGFSTRDRATAISGRGVGLDVVRTLTEQLGGTVDVEWEAGRGTLFRLSVPVSVATTRMLLVRAGGQPFALPSHFVRRVERRPLAELRRAGTRLFIPAEPSPIPVRSLVEILGLPGGLAEAGALSVVLLSAPAGLVALVVDEVLDERELVLRPLEGAGPAAAARYAGAALARGAGVVLALEAGYLFAASAGDGAESALAAKVGGRGERRRPRVLVVDDSITSRTLEESVLTAAGYDVTTAVDGADGWRRVREGGFDAVMTDVEMPNMDGLTLCATIRASRDFARLPVVLLTSLDQPEHVARGLEVGADAYLTKSRFDQEEFLLTVRQLIGAGA